MWYISRYKQYVSAPHTRHYTFVSLRVYQNLNCQLDHLYLLAYMDHKNCNNKHVVLEDILMCIFMISKWQDEQVVRLVVNDTFIHNTCSITRSFKSQRFKRHCLFACNFTSTLKTGIQ